MNLEQAIKAAEKPVQPAVATDNKDPYAIPFEFSNCAISLIGKTIRNRDNMANSLKIVKWVGQNYVVQVNNTEEHDILPVMWLITRKQIYGDKMIIA